MGVNTVQSGISKIELLIGRLSGALVSALLGVALGLGLMAGIDSGRARLVIHRLSFAPRAAIVVGGPGIHALAAVLTDPMPTSDGRTYLDLAVKLAAGEPYISWDGHRAFWPWIAAVSSSLYRSVRFISVRHHFDKRSPLLVRSVGDYVNVAPG